MTPCLLSMYESICCRWKMLNDSDHEPRWVLAVVEAVDG